MHYAVAPPTFTCANSTVEIGGISDSISESNETPEQCVKSVQS